MKKEKPKQIMSILLTLIMIISALPLAAISSFAITSDDYEYEVISETDKTCEITKYTGNATDLTIPSGLGGYTVTSIEYEAFYESTTLISITIPDSVVSIGNFGFDMLWGCASLTSINVSDSNTAYSSLNGVLFNKDKTKLVYCPEGKVGNYVIPNSVTCIGDYAFYYCTMLTSIVIPDSVVNINDYAFSACSSLEDINIPNSVTNIGTYAFIDCISLSNVILPDTVTSIGYWAFMNTAFYINELNWENGVLYIGNHLIEAKDDILGNYSIRPGTKTIADLAFSSCTSLESINVPDENTVYSSLDGVLFNKDKTLLICYPAGKTNNSYTIPSKVMSIREYAFFYCTSLTSVVIPDSVLSISGLAFEECTSLTTIFGYLDSFAELYAKSYGYYFVVLSDVTSPTEGKNGIIRPVDKTTTVNNVVTQLKSMLSGVSEITVTNASGSAITDLTQACQNGMKFTVIYSDNTTAIYEIENATPGDINGDGIIDAGDAVLIQRYDAGLIELTVEQLADADVTGDGIVDAGDAVKIQRYDAGLINKL